MREDSQTLLQAAAQGCLDAVQAALSSADVVIDAVDDQQRTPLMHASSHGHVDVVKSLLQHGACAGAQDEEEQTALIMATQEGHEHVVRLLLDHGASMNESAGDNTTPIHWEARNGHQNVVRVLLDHGANIDAFDQDGNTALMWAAREGLLGIAKLLIDRGAQVDAIRNGLRTALMHAAFHGHAEIAELLIEHGADVNAVENDEDEWTSLMLASQEGHEQVVQLLLDHGASVNKSANDKATALHWAVQMDHEKVVRILVNHGADINAFSEDGFTPLMWAANGNLLEIAEFLIERGAKVDAIQNGLRTALMMAAFAGHVNVAKLLVRHGADVNAVENDDDEWTPLMLASQEGKDQVVKLLLDNGAYMNKSAKDKSTPLHWATHFGRQPTVQLLISRGAAVDAKNNSGQTSLMVAASEGHLDVVRTLLKAGASFTNHDENGQPALVHAVINEHVDIVRELVLVDTELSHGMELLKLGLQKQKLDAEEKEKVAAETKAEVKLEDLVDLCTRMNEAQSVTEHLYSRLSDMETQLKMLNEVTEREATMRFKQLLERSHGLMSKHADKHTITRLVGSQVIIDSCRDLHRKCDAFLLQYDLPLESGVHDWKLKWTKDSAAMKLRLKDSLKQKEVLMSELQDPEAQAEALTLLMFECDSNESQYSEEEMALINEIFQYVASLSRLEILSVPQWFVPPHEVDFNARTSFAGGSYGSVHHGTWNGTAVVVKSAFLEDDKSREMFLNETEIWFKLQHPHIVTLFRACHVGNPFFVCDLASNGTLSEYLYRDKNHFETWAKLHEAALGLHYLHTKHKVVHGDLKCNNILISADGKAKLTDFGLSFTLHDQDEDEDEATSASHEVGAIRWKAPEVISGKTRGTLASDVYAFGMCIIEAVTGRVPWGLMPDVAVKHKTLTQMELPKQPTKMSDAQWSLVQRMCAWEPSDRIDIGAAVKELVTFAEEELDLKMEAEWAEDDDDEPIAEPRPFR